jgi:hypothetical protein
MIRRMGWFLGGLTLAATGVYTIVYLYRWEWNRALFTGVLFVAVEVGLVGTLVLRRVAALQRSVEEGAGTARVLARLQESAPRRDHFAWLERTTSQTGVFVTVLLGAGVLLSASTWLIDRVASRTATPTLERALACRLERAAFPEGPLVPDDAELVAQGGPYGEDQHVGILLGPRR